MGEYFRPTECADALLALGERPWTVLAGGTDHYPARVARSPAEDILDITAIESLRSVTQSDTHVRIGATTTWSEIFATPLPAYFDALKQAAREIGGLQIQNAGTIAGNLCNASPAADGVPALLALDATVEVASRENIRQIPLAEFITAPRRTACRPHELVTAIIVPKMSPGACSRFLKLGARRYLVISIVMVAVALEHRSGTVTSARVAVGACSPVAQRLPILERELIGRPFAAGLGARVTAPHLEALTPIDDVRGEGAYRLEAARTLIARALEALGSAA